MSLPRVPAELKQLAVRYTFSTPVLRPGQIWPRVLQGEVKLIRSFTSQGEDGDDGWLITCQSERIAGHSVVRDFYAQHAIHGQVWGNFERHVWATSTGAYNAFRQKHAEVEFAIELGTGVNVARQRFDPVTGQRV
jgi:hypothetical protein